MISNPAKDLKLKNPTHQHKKPRKPRGPKPIADVIGELLVRRGIGRQLATEQNQTAWMEAVGDPLAQFTRCGKVYRRRLEVIAANSTAIQELTFRKEEIMRRLQETAPQLDIDDIRFKLGTVE